MPVVDMPLKELETYQGMNPCPEDMDSFWERSLAEMRAVRSEVELKPAEFSCPFADCFDMYFTGVRGARIYTKLVKPKTIKGKVPAVLFFHGYSWDSGDWNRLLAFAAAGFVVAAMDCRGQGGRSEDIGGVTGNTLHGHIIRGLGDKPENMLMRHIFLDCAQLAGIIMNMPEVDESRVGAAGGSQGGGLTIACAALEPRVQRIAPQMPFLSDYKRVWTMDSINGAYEEIQEYFKRFDPLHEREDEIFTQLGYIDIQHLAKRIRCKVIMAVGLMDTVCPASSQFAAYNKILGQKRLYLYPDFAHEDYPGWSDKVYEFMLGM